VEMKEQTADSQAQRTTYPHQVWQTLTAAQQKTVVQTVVHICHNLATNWEQEESNESDADQ